MKHNLLYKIPENEVYKDEELAANLMLDETFSRFSYGSGSLELFKNILTSPLQQIENIAYRREILKDFQKTPRLLSTLESLFGKLDDLRREKQGERSFIARTFGVNDPEKFSRQKAAAQMCALSLKTTLLALKEICENILSFSSNSDGLKSLVNRLRTIYNDKNLSLLLDICDLFSGIGDNNVYTLCLKLDKDAKIESCKIVKIDDLQPVIKKWFSKSSDKAAKNCVLSDPFNQLCNEILGTALLEINELFLKIEANIFSEFSDIPQHLAFYKAALNYCEFMQKTGYPLTFPEIVTDKNTEITNLYDILLCQRKDEVVPNDVALRQGRRGILIRGKNNSGKTVYLRSLGIAQLLSQAGLPIAADKATVSVKSGVYTQFAASEKGPIASDAGRFEQEVRALKNFIDNIRPNSLVLLNETFQTTAYDEGAEGLYHILNYFGAMGSQWVLATHLHKLFDMFGDNEVTKYEMIPLTYKLRCIN